MATLQQMQALLDGPALVPPPGIKPNFVNPENQTRYFVLTIVLTVTVSTFALLMRVYTKTCLIRKVGWEDCTLYLASNHDGDPDCCRYIDFGVLPVHRLLHSYLSIDQGWGRRTSMGSTAQSLELHTLCKSSNQVNAKLPNVH